MFQSLKGFGSDHRTGLASLDVTTILFQSLKGFGSDHRL